jgi:hypothetical protein
LRFKCFLPHGVHEHIAVLLGFFEWNHVGGVLEPDEVFAFGGFELLIVAFHQFERSVIVVSADEEVYGYIDFLDLFEEIGLHGLFPQASRRELLALEEMESIEK